MKKAPRVLVVIPVYNHGTTLRDVVKRTLEVHPQVLVVDDGSTDNGVERLEGLDVQIVRHPHNLGKGAAIQTGAGIAMEQSMTHILTLDADGQHDPADIPRFMEKLEDNNALLLVGKRDFDAAPIPRISRFGRSFSNFWVRIQTGQKVGDSQSGFRLYPLSIFSHLRFRETGYAFEIEVLVRSAWAGFKLRDVDISVHYPPKEERISHFQLLTDNIKISLLNTRLTIRSMLPWPHRKIMVHGREGDEVSIIHPLKSIRLLLENDATPMELSLSGGLGVLLGGFPILFVKTLLILCTAGYLNLNRFAALGASQIWMPPFGPAVCIEAGYFLRHGHFLTEISMETLGYQALQRVFEWFLGALVLGPVIGFLVGLLIYVAAQIIKFQMRAMRRIVQR